MEWGSCRMRWSATAKAPPYLLLFRVETTYRMKRRAAATSFGNNETNRHGVMIYRDCLRSSITPVIKTPANSNFTYLWLLLDLISILSANRPLPAISLQKIDSMVSRRLYPIRRCWAGSKLVIYRHLFKRKEREPQLGAVPFSSPDLHADFFRPSCLDSPVFSFAHTMSAASNANISPHSHDFRLERLPVPFSDHQINLKRKKNSMYK